MKRIHLLLIITLFSSIITKIDASPQYYLFEGIITDFDSRNDDVSLSDYDVVLGETEVSYVFEVYFDRNTGSYTNTAGTWYFFYSDLLEGGIINGVGPEDNESYNVYFNTWINQGRLQGGSRVSVWTSDADTSSWKVQDWSVGQELKLIDGGYIPTESGGAVYFFGDLVLNAISTTYPIADPNIVAIDIKPQSCPNPLNVKSKGVLPVAILGSEVFDVNDIDPNSVEILGVTPIRYSYEDVATPADVNVLPEDCFCSADGPDGYPDMMLKFDTPDIIEAIGEVQDGDYVVLTLTGSLKDGTPIEGTDCVMIIKKGKN